MAKATTTPATGLGGWQRADLDAVIVAHAGLWELFAQHYLGTAVKLHGSLTRELYPWYEHAEIVREQFITRLEVRGYDAATRTFLDQVFAITPLGAARVAERTSSLAGYCEALTGHAFTEEHVLAMHMTLNSLVLLRSIGARLAGRSYDTGDAAWLVRDDYRTTFTLLGDYLRTTA